MTNLLSDRTYLYNRHRLSHQQIDKWLGENRSKEFMPEKLKQLEAVKHFLSVTDLLSQNGISFVSLKGPLLSLRIYGDPAVRVSHDIDILIGTEHIESAIKIFFEKGYHFAENSYWPQKKAAKKLFVSAVHHLGFYNKELQIYVEVHWVLLHELTTSFKKQKKIIADNVTEMVFAGRKFAVLTKEFELLYLLIHGSRHKWNRLKWLVDINDYPVEEVDIIAFNRLVEQLHAARIVGQANYFLKKYFNSQMPFKGDDRLPKYFISHVLQSIDGEIKEKLSAREMISKYRYLWFLFPGFYYKSKLTALVLLRPGNFSLFDLSYKVIDYLSQPLIFIRRRIFHA